GSRLLQFALLIFEGLALREEVRQAGVEFRVAPRELFFGLRALAVPGTAVFFQGRPVGLQLLALGPDELGLAVQIYQKGLGLLQFAFLVFEGLALREQVRQAGVNLLAVMAKALVCKRSFVAPEPLLLIKILATLSEVGKVVLKLSACQSEFSAPGLEFVLLPLQGRSLPFQFPMTIFQFFACCLPGRLGKRELALLALGGTLTGGP
ncbi:MAG: hypothetical protein HUU20_20895, partial [Pirellulales bacterium]|nr:hypothetical protein [Pirellulales bacterium]